MFGDVWGILIDSGATALGIAACRPRRYRLNVAALKVGGSY